MKLISKSPIYALILLMSLVFTSCQKETEAPQPQVEPQALTDSSLLVKLIRDVSSYDGSFDNIVDGASCLAIKFPYTVVVNGEEIAINSKEDFNEIELLFDAYELDEDILEIQYPVTVILSNFSQILVEDEAELNALADQCIEGGDDADNECIDFIYPITLFTFDVNNEQLGRVVVERDSELRLFLAGLDENDRVSFDFPISLLKYNGEQIVVNSNLELIQAINGSVNSCDEDDDDDYNDDDFSQDRLENLLIECTWLIKELDRDDNNISAAFYLSVLNFNSNGTVEYEDDLGGVQSGTWSTELEGNTVLLNIAFDALSPLNSTWTVYELEEGKIKLETEADDKMILQSACAGHNNSAEILQATLEECSWIIKKVEKVEELSELQGYDLSFLPGNVVVMENGSTTINGSWEVTNSGGLQPVLNLDMESGDPSISFAWPLDDIAYERLKFKDDTGDYELILEKNCYNDNYDEEVGNIRQAIKEGSWQVTAFTYNSDPNFISYTETFLFAPEGVFKLDNAMIGANWRIYRNSEQELELILTFENGSNYQYMGNDWEIVEISENLIELVHEDEPNDYDHLIFQRP
ncbi:hypothetical protein [Muriicola sp. Z0-33]|uniref:hypothetical protein n=1 Tax=Muriicola sp. Z0-33 TaxID=2816957 RepID=UPI00223719F7|nr:hypothetical protein [Muriicola sp. Z0-33]MCW5516831.1 hypothetical protein [Muriicola sp. Z0-33]